MTARPAWLTCLESDPPALLGAALWIAAEHESDDELAGEISQLLYWTQVLMIKRGLTLDDVYGKL